MKPNASTPDTIRAAAARWLIRRDRGLSSAESIEYELWLAADERHAAAMKRSAGVWSLLDAIPEPTATPVLAAVTRRRSFWRRTRIISTFAAAAAALVVGLVVWQRPDTTSTQFATFPQAATDRPRTVTLSDGSLVQLNTGGEVIEQFTTAERRVLLVHGEAHFSVTKNPARPFVVRAGELQVRAVGTAFNVNFQPSGVDVLVTEGRVQLATESAATAASSSVPPPAPALGVGERALLRAGLTRASDLAAALIISRLDNAEMARALAWREPLLRLSGATLAQLAVEFERSTGRRIVFADPALADVQFGGRFRADDIEGFAHVLATTLEIDVERATDGTIVLRKKK